MSHTPSSKPSSAASPAPASGEAQQRDAGNESATPNSSTDAPRAEEQASAAWVPPAYFGEAMTYAGYRQLIRKAIANGGTTGPVQNEALANFTKLNDHRMDRVEKTVELPDAVRQRLRHLKRPMDWLVLSEGWCGDAAASVPILECLADASPILRMRILLRDDHTDLMDQFLTNGGRSIPKLIAMEAESGRVLFSWGPRPEPAQKLVNDWKSKAEPEPYSEFVKSLQLWYARDKGKTTIQEIMALVDAADPPAQ
jgi:hypothetical protein